MRLAVAIALASFAAIGAAIGVAGAEPAPMRAVVRLADPADRERLTRIEGQTVDVAVTLVAVATEPVEPTLAAQLEAARRLAELHRARAVIWFRDDGEQLIVAVADPVEDTLFVRRVEARRVEAAIASSAASEAAALIVRSALRALAAGGRIGVQAPPPAPPLPPASPPRPAHAASVAAASWHAGLGAVAAVDGASPVHAGATAWLGRSLGGWRLDLVIAASPASRLEDQLTSVSLRRYSAGVAFGRVLGAGFAAELSGGGIGYERESSAVDPAVVAAPPARLWAAYLGPGVRWSYGARVRLELALGIDAIAGAPELGYAVADRFERRNRLWILQPRASLGVGVAGF